MSEAERWQRTPPTSTWHPAGRGHRFRLAFNPNDHEVGWGEVATVAAHGSDADHRRLRLVRVHRGATSADLGRPSTARRRHRTESLDLAWKFLLAIVAFQLVADHLVPNVAWLGHISGLAIGCLLGLGFARRAGSFVAAPATT